MSENASVSAVGGPSFPQNSKSLHFSDVGSETPGNQLQVTCQLRAEEAKFASSFLDWPGIVYTDICVL